MTSRKIGISVSLLAVCLLSLGSALAADKIKGKGVITLRSGNTLTVETDDDAAISVIVTADTKVQHPVGLGARKKEVGQEVLIPGLKLKFEGTGDWNQVTAETITFDRDDLSLAKVIQAGLNPTAQQQAQNMQAYQANKQATDAEIAANKAAIAAHQREIEETKEEIAANQQGIQEVAQSTQKRFSDLSTWYVKGEASVRFEVGDSALSGADQQAIANLARQALTYTGFVIEVRGYADSTGRLEDNQQLSKERAQAVVAYLLQDCHVPVKNITAPGAMGVANPAASNETASGRAENRRVDLKLLVNKGVAGGE
ncbi:MAG: OmpA family protein [Terriglobales bacterium]|jgi:outer membrane protein OmpA-like peptidoglycan-associated protein